MDLRKLWIIASLILIAGASVSALEPVRSRNVLQGLIGRVGTDEPAVAGPAGQSPPGKRALPVRAVPISAIGNPRAFPAPGPTSHERRDSGPTPAAAVVRSSPLPIRVAKTTEPRQPLGSPRLQSLAPRLEKLIAAPPSASPVAGRSPQGPQVIAKALFCLDCTTNEVILARNDSAPLPIASITKLLTAMTVVDHMNLDDVVRVPDDIRTVPRHRVGIQPGDRLTVRDLLHGMLIESGNDCAEALARAYPKGGRTAFLRLMNRKAELMGAKNARVFTPSGLDMNIVLGRKGDRALQSRKPNVASAADVAIIARRAFTYPLIREISGMKTYIMRSVDNKGRNYVLRTNDKLLHSNLPVAGAKTGYTDLAGKCIVALFKDKTKDFMIVVLNARNHFKAAARIYQWACRML